jgi:hypothetical protein
MSTLTIDNVDFDELEEQRKMLIDITFNDDINLLLTPDQHEALIGISNMLDFWSDERYFAKHPEQMGLSF